MCHVDTVTELATGVGVALGGGVGLGLGDGVGVGVGTRFAPRLPPHPIAAQASAAAAMISGVLFR